MDLLFYKTGLIFLKVDLSLQDSGPFLCEGGSSKSTEPPPPGYGPELWTYTILTDTMYHIELSAIGGGSFYEVGGLATDHQLVMHA